MSVSEGQRLGNYRLHRLLGKGSFAEVYLGEHLYLKNYAALKILHTTLDEKEEQLFLTEAQTIAGLVHPNIIRVREFAIENSIPFLVMDYVPGGTLRHRYPRGTCLSLEQTVTYVKQIASALQYAHNQGLIHRDVKPENALQGAGQVMLSDFGISVSVPKLTGSSSGSWAGTLAYMAPEQFQGQAVFASDQYSLAILAYEWLCGVRPFEGSGAVLAYQHAHVSPPGLREKDPSLPEAVEAVVLKALSKHPKQRYVSVLTFARALERACRGESSATIGLETENADAPLQTTTRRIFLSQDTADDSTNLCNDLSLRDIAVQDVSAEETREEQTRQSIRAAQAVLLLLTPHSRPSAAVQDHLRIAHLYRRRILCLWTQGETLHGLLPAGAEQVSILDARGQRYAQALDELVQTLEQEHRGVTTVEPPLPDLSFEPRNPYKGLRAFTQHDRADFFGRQALVQELLASLKQQIVTPATTDEPRPRLLAIIGPSGSGKSSAAMAGLLPALQEGVLPGSEQWVYLDPLVPGLQPLEALAHLLATRFPQQDPQNIRQILFREGGFGLHQLGMMLMSQPQARLIVTIDQFEELFSSDIPEAERLRFIQLLVTAACEPRGPVLVLLTLRADFYDRPFAYSELGRLIQQQQCPVLPMSLEELREVIERPALLPDVRLTFDEDLVGDLLFDLHGQAAALPLLEFTLEQLFHHRRDRRLTRRAYQEIGGVRGALSRHAEATYAELPSEEHRRLARTMFLRLVQPGIQGQEPLRRRADISEFALEHAEQTHLMRQVIDAFLSARLLTSVQLIETSALEISHEALIREWPRLSNWLQEAREDMQFQQTISHDVREWEQRGKPKDRLYRGSQLKEAKTWQERNTASSIEAAFLRASTTRRTRTRISLMLASLLLLAILLPAGLLFQQQLTPLTVTTLQDDAPGSLRQAIANTRSGGTILIDAHLKGILFLNKELVITRDLTVRGSGINQVVIRGKRDLPGSLMTIQSHATVTLFHLTFSDPTPGLGTIISNYGTLTIEECQLTGNIQKGIPSQYLQGGLSVSGAGGAMRNSGTLILYKSLIARNTVAATTGDGFGGGIFSTGGTLIINDSQIVENTLISSGQHASGGGIFSQQDRLTISNSTISGNSVQGRKEGYGGGIMSLGSNISIDHSQFQGNTVVGQTQAFGGAILSLDLTSSNKVVATGTVSIIDSVLSNNHVTGATQIRGGGIAALSGSVTLSRTSITDNVLLSQQQVAGGAGLFILNGTLTVTDSLVSGNSATAPADQFGALGGGIYTAGTLILQRSTISLNTVNSHQGIAGGGGIYADDRARSPNARLQLANCTIANNQAQGSQGLGGGLSLYLVPIKSSSMDFCTIADNVASTQGGGIYSDPANTPKTALLSLKNSIVASNTAKADPDISGNIITDGYNLVQRWTGAQFNDPHSMHKTDLSVNPSASMGIATQLGMNGGVTPTLALQAGSPAIDAVPASACDVSTDQRGVKRPQHNACDIGAYEYS